MENKAFHWGQIFTIVLLSYTSQNLDIPIQSSESQRNVFSIDSSVTRLADLLIQTEAFQTDANLVFSPVSVQIILNLLLEASTGRSSAQLENALGYQNIRNLAIHQTFNKHMMYSNTSINYNKSNRAPDNIYTVNTAIFAANHIDIGNEWRKFVENYYNVEIKKVQLNDQSATSIINNWVRKKSFDKIQKLLNQLSNQVQFILVNVVYLNCLWKIPFDEKLTTEKNFFVNSEKIAKIPTMFVQDEFLSISNNIFQAVFLPYNYRNMGMLIIMPDDLEVFESKLNAEYIEQILGLMKNTTVEIELPRFTIKTLIDLKNILNEMNVSDIFVDGVASLKKMSNSSSLFIDKIFQQSVIEVSEKGTKAVGVTYTIATRFHSSIKIAFNRPFIFIIMDRYKRVPLFWGHFIQPM